MEGRTKGVEILKPSERSSFRKPEWSVASNVERDNEMKIGQWNQQHDRLCGPLSEWFRWCLGEQSQVRGVLERMAGEELEKQV